MKTMEIIYNLAPDHYRKWYFGWFVRLPEQTIENRGQTQHIYYEKKGWCR